MPATIINLFPIPPAPALPGLATGGTPASASAGNPTTPQGTTPPPVAPPVGGIPVVTSLPSPGEPGAQVMLGGVLYQFVGAAQYPGIPGFWEPVVGDPPALQDTHANRLANYPASNYAAGTLFFETDRTVVYKSDGSTWNFWSGAMAGALSALPVDLGASDAGFHFQATDFRHLYLWAGSAWNFDPADQGSGFTVLAGPGFFISNGLWGLCNGSTYSVAQSAGGTANQTPAVAANTYLRR